MAIHDLDETQASAVQRDLERLGATCRVAIKRMARGRWEVVRREVMAFHDALATAGNHAHGVFEVGVFLDHERYGGTLIWSSSEPDVVNSFEHLGE